MLEDRLVLSHFRGAAMIPGVSASGLLTLTSTSFWRPTFVAGIDEGGDPVVSNLDTGATVGAMADGTRDPNDTSDSRFTRVVQTHTIQLPGAGRYGIRATSCCRVAGIRNAVDSNWTMDSIIVWNGSSANTPITFNFSAVQPEVVRGQDYSGNLSAIPAPGVTLSYDQILNQNINSQPPGFTIDTSTGALFIPAASTTGYLDNNASPPNVGADYAFSGNITASDGSKVEFDWMFDAVDTSSNRAPVVTDATINAKVGDMIMHTFTATDPDGDPLTWSFVQILGPGGATPAIAPTFDTATQKFAWDTTGSVVGTWSVQVQARDSHGLTDIGILTINLTAANRVNDFTPENQNDPDIAMDADGDFVVTWTSHCQDPSDAAVCSPTLKPSGVFGQRFTPTGARVGPNFQVNTFTPGDQFDSAVAMDGDGDFVVVWTSLGQDPGDGPNDGGIYGQRFTRTGAPIGGEFRVHTTVSTTTPFNQREPDVAMDQDGNFVVVWSGPGTPDNLGVYARIFNEAGVPLGNELLVNMTTSNDQKDPAIAMDHDGDFVVTWEGFGKDVMGGMSNGVIARAFDRFGVALGDEFPVNTTPVPGGVPFNPAPAIAMEAGGDFVVVWDADGGVENSSIGGDADGIFGQRFNADTTLRGKEFKVGTITRLNQEEPAIGMDHNGEFVVTWTSWGHTPDPDDRSDIQAQRYDRNGDPVGPQFRVNVVTAENQKDSAVALDSDGNFTVAYASFGQDGSSPPSDGVFVEQFMRSPIMTSVRGEFRVNTYTRDTQSLSPSPNDENSTRSIGMNPEGTFVVAWTSFGQDGSLTDSRGVFARRYNQAGFARGKEFQVNTSVAGEQFDPAVAVDVHGNFVVVWQGAGPTSPPDDPDGIYAQMFNAAGVPLGGEFRVNTTTAGPQTNPTIAIDPDGNFIIAWVSEDTPVPNFSVGIWARRFNAFGVALDATEFLVHAPSILNQTNPAVATDSDNEFIVTWVSQDTPPPFASNGVWARRFTAAAVPIDAAEFLVNATTANDQSAPSVAMDFEGNFVVTWRSFDQDAILTYGVFARRFLAAFPGVPAGPEFRVNTTVAGEQTRPSVAMHAEGDFVIVWHGHGINPSPFAEDFDGIFGQRYAVDATPVGGEFIINSTLSGVQQAPAIAIDADHHIGVVWSGNGPGDTEGIFAYRESTPGPGAITGQKFEDLDGDGVKDAGEPALPGWTIFVDLDNDGVLDNPTSGNSTCDLKATEPCVVTDAEGNYAFQDLDPGTYRVREILQTGWLQTTPEFAAALSGANENPTNTSPALGFMRFSLDESTGELFFEVSFEQVAGNTTGLHIHRGAPGVNGPILFDLVAAAGLPASDPFGSPVTGVVTLSAGDVADLLAGNLYVNLHSSNLTGGEIRGQIVASTAHVVPIVNGLEATDRDFGNFRKITVSGKKFNDLDGNGNDNGGTDPGLAGWTIFVDTNNDGVLNNPISGDGVCNGNAVERCAITGAGGNYSITNAGPGVLRLREVLQSGWQQTTANPPNARAISGVNVTGVNFGNRQVSLGSISGMKFNDLDGDGVKDGGEPGLPGWTIFLDLNNNGQLDTNAGLSSPDVPKSIPDVSTITSTITVTGFGGTLTDLNVTLDITHTWDADMEVFLISPLGTRVELFSDVGGSGDNFSNPTLDDEAATAIDSANAPFTGSFRPVGLLSAFDGQSPNGTWTLEVTDDEAADTGTLNSWSLALGGVSEPSQVTDGSGNYSFINLVAGTYRVRELLQAGWLQTTPNPAPIVLASGGTATGVHFGNFQRITISGLKFQDTDGDGAKQAGEPGLAGWTIFLDADNDGVLDAGETSTTTNSTGDYSFANLGPGTYRVREVGQAGWTQTTPDPADIVASSGTNVSAINFGNQQQSAASGSISGVKFNDLDGDGTRDTGEPGLPGWTMFLDQNANGVLDSVVTTVNSTDVPKSINDVATATSTLAVSGIAGTLADVNVTLNITHTFDADLDVFLISPTGTRVELFTDVGGGNDNFTNTTLDDEAAAGIATGAAPFTGSFRPEGTLFSFDGQNPNGTWTLEITDDQGSDVGTLNSWSLALSVGEPSTTTDAAGNYSFTGLTAGTYRVREILQAGWIQTTVNPAPIVLSTGQAVTGVAFGNFQRITISGQKFQDTDGDGVKDSGETGLVGWTIFLDADNDGVFDVGETNTTTNASGNYSFASLGPGTHRVREVTQAGWLQTTPNPAAIVASSGSNVAGVDFGNFQRITVSGQKFQDSDGDGVKDPGEPGLAGWTIFLDIDKDGTLDAGEPSTTTIAGGTYSFPSLGPGSYRVREIVQTAAGWFQTTTNPPDFVAASGQNVSGVDFGNFQRIAISGQKFQDTDGDGVKDPGEPGLVSWTIFLDADNDGVLDAGESSMLTDSSGNYSFANLGPGTYRVREAVQAAAGWVQSSANPADIVASSGQNATAVNFGNFQRITISGQKFQDTDGNSVKDPGEGGLPGWTIYLDANNNGALDPGEPTSQTNAGGNYSFPNLGPGTYRVREDVQTKAGWIQTTVNPAAILAMSGVNVSGVDFGNRQLVAGANPTWTPVGPAPIKNGQIDGRLAVSGRIAGIAADPSDPNTIYIAAAGGGVWKTTNGGNGWTPLTDMQETLFMGAIALAPSDPNTIYAGTGEATFSLLSFYGRGILKSTDAGASWTLLGQSVFDRRAISQIVVDPNNPNTVYAAVGGGGVNGLPGNNGVWKSTDGGVNWTLTTPAGLVNSPFTDLVIDRSNPNILYAAALGSGIHKTTNAGGSWSPLGGGLPTGSTVGNTKIAIARSAPNTVYASIANPSTGGLLKMMKTTNGGANWTDLTANVPTVFDGFNTFTYLGGQGWYDSTLAVDPSNADIVYAAGSAGSISVITSRNGGATWAGIGTGSDGNGPHADHHGIGFDAAGRLLDGNDGGIWRLDNATFGSIRWANLNSNLNTIQFIGIALHPTNPAIAFGGSQDNGTERYEGAPGWSLVDFGDGGFARVDPGNPNTVYHTRASVNRPIILRSDNLGVEGSWIGIDDTRFVAEEKNFYPPLVTDGATGGRVLIGGVRIYESTNGGNNWTQISQPNTAGWLGADRTDSIGTCRIDANTIYASAGGHIYFTNNRGATWQHRDTPGPHDNYIDIQVDPTDCQTAYAVRNLFGGGHVWRSTNGGGNWTDISGNLPDLPTLSVEIDPKGPGSADDLLYVGNDNGVYLSMNLGASWSRYGVGLPNVQVRDLELKTNLGILAAGTHGRGMWQIGAATAPTNDSFANSLALTGGTATGNGTNLNATKEAGEPNHAGNPGGTSVWWSWTAPASGNVTLSTAGSDFNTLLAVYTGSAVSSLNPVASNDDFNGAPQSQVSFTAVAGTTYQFAVDGAGGVAGTVKLNLTQTVAVAPANDNFANATILSGMSATSGGTNVAATKETGEPNHAGNPGGRSVWWRWTAPANGNVTITTATSTFNTLLAVYTGTTVSGLTSVASNDDFGGTPQSQVTFAATAGTTYRVAVDGSGGVTGSVALALTQTVTTAPANDNFANAALLSGASATAGGSNVGATKEAGEPNHAGNAGGHSVWWTWTAPGTGDVMISTAATKFDTLLAVYTGASVAAVTPVAFNDNFGGTLQSQVNFKATAGTVYRIAVDGFAGIVGNITLTLSAALSSAPANDNFAGRIALTGTSSVTGGTNVGATKEPGEPNHAGRSGGASVWWSWTAPASGTVTITTLGSTFDTVLAAYTGSTVAGLVEMASNDNFGKPPHVGTSQITFAAVGGTSYAIAVDGVGATPGAITLALTETVTVAPANDNFLAPVNLAGASVMSAGSNVAATKQVGEPNHAGNPGGASVWWTWTAPFTGTATVSTVSPPGTNFDTLLAAYVGSSLGGLIEVASNDNFGASQQSQISFGAKAGGLYHIAVDGSGGATGNIALSIMETATAPDNDDFASSSILSGLNPMTMAVNLAATKEPGEPNHAGNAGGSSVWWSWTAPGTGTVTVRTAGSTFDTLLAVYTGASVGVLTPVASNDDFGGTSQSEVTFAATAGTTYRIAVDGVGGTTGNVTLGLTEMLSAATNDNFANSIALVGGTATTMGSNVGATKEAGEPDHAGNTGGKSVWWHWTAPSSGTVTVSTAGSSFDTVLGIYTGAPVATLGDFTENDDFGGTLQSQVSFFATAGTTYRIAVDGFGGDSGTVALSLGATTGGPANDNFANAVALNGSAVKTGASNANATKEPSEPSHGGNAGGTSVWWSWTAPFAGNVTISTAGSSFDTLLGVYMGSSVSTLTPVAGNDDFGGTPQSQVSFAAAAGTTYRIAVDGFSSASGNVALALTALATSVTPANDNFANAAALSGPNATTAGSNAGASKESNEPDHANQPPSRSVWWNWTAPGNGNVTISTAGSGFDTVLAIYTGGALGSLVEVASNDDFGATSQSQVSLPTVNGTVYRIAVDGFGGAAGNIVLALNGQFGPLNNNFASAQTIAGNSGMTAGTNVGANKEAGEQNHAGSNGGASVWYRWTPAATGIATIDTAGSNFDTLLAVYAGSTVSSLTEIAQNDDVSFPTIRSSRVTFGVLAGNTYQIAVDGFNDPRIGTPETGDITLHWSLEPAPTVQFSAASYAADEAAGSALVTVTLIGGSAQPVTVEFSTRDGTATTKTDYTPAVERLTFRPGETSKTILVKLKKDKLDEVDETIDLTLRNPTGGVLAPPSTATLTVRDDDPPPLVRFKKTKLNVKESAGSAIITVSLGAASGLPVSVNYATSDGPGLTPARAGFDYTSTASPPALRFAPGAKTATFAVPIINDPDDEPNETFTITLSGATNGTLGPVVSLLVTIRDDDRPSPVVVVVSASRENRERTDSRAQPAVNSDGRLRSPHPASVKTVPSLAAGGDAVRQSPSAAAPSLARQSGRKLGNDVDSLTIDALLESGDLVGELRFNCLLERTADK